MNKLLGCAVATMLLGCHHTGDDTLDLAVVPGVDGGCIEGCTTRDLGGDAGGALSHIEHIVVVVKENHSFDNYFGSFPGAEGTSTAVTTRGTIAVPRPPLLLTRDLDHSHPAGLTDWDHGKMDQWDLGDAPNASDNLAYAQYQEADIPNYWALARAYGLADHYHSGMIGPSFPGHMFYFAAQAAWTIDNPSQTVPWGCDDAAGTTIPTLPNGCGMEADVFPCFEIPVVPDLLPANLTWGVYATTLPPLVGEPWAMLDAIGHIRNSAAWKSHVFDVSQLAKDVAANKLPNVVWVIDQDLASEHPPLNVCTGENWSIDVVNTIMKSSYWDSTAVLITWDDFGGWYDHVAPPKQYGCDATNNPYGVGFRLPLIIVSPWVKPHTVYHAFSTQASIPRFIEAVFHLGALHDLDSAAQDTPDIDDLTGAFDFEQAPNPPIALTDRNCLLQR
jgi:phospholipase C